jgi:tellurite resistance protein TehA-like permease
VRPTGAGAPGPSRVQRVLDAVPPAAGAVVMGSGILCVDLYTVGQPLVASVLLWFAAGSWLFLAAVLAQRARHEPGRFGCEARSPAALTGVAGSGVLGTAFAAHGYYPVAVALLGLAGLSWALLLTPVLSHWETPVAGVSFLLTVATQGLAVLGATLAARAGAAWLLIAAVAALILGLAFYIVTVTRFAPRQLLTGHGDQWVAGGALAISALACAKITQADGALDWLTWMHGVLAVAALVLWCLAMLWLGPLIAAEALRPRLSYDVRRWATVFPVGMYAACSIAVSQVTGITGIGVFARVWTWLAVTVSVFVFGGLIRRSWQVLRGSPDGAFSAPARRNPPR